MIITIGRQHGSNGHAVAETLAKRLNIPCYSKEIVDRTARDSNFSHEVIRSYDEKRISPFISLADEGDAVFVGRCADYVLRSREDLVRVFLMADMPYRIKTVMERKNLTPEQAKKLIREVDKDRSSYYRYYTDQTWGESGCYDLCLNVGRVGIEGAAEAIEAFVKAIK